MRAVLFAAILLLYSAHTEAADKITLQLRWLHQFQFAGYYAAQEKGFYDDAGLDVTIVAGGPGKDAVKGVLAGQSQFAVANHELLLNRLRGKPLMVLATIFQHSPAVFLVRRDSGIRSPQDLVGRRVMTIGGKPDIGLISMLRSEGVNPEQVKFQKSSFDINDLVNGNTDAFNSYLTNEPYFLDKLGVSVTVINPATYGIDFYSDILFTSEDEVRNHPDRVKRFRKASLLGWKYAMQNQEEIIDLILRKYTITKTREHLQFEANAMIPLILPNLIEMGHINPGRFKHMADIFVREGMANSDYSLEGLIYDPDPTVDLKKWYQLVVGLVVVLLVVVIVIFVVVYYNGKLKREIAERTLAENEIEKQRDELRKLNQQKDKFFSIIAHDLKSPFTALLGYSSMLSSGAANFDQNKLVESSRAVHESAESVFKLLENLLEWSRLQRGRMEFDPGLVDLKEIFDTNFELFAPTAKDKAIQLTDLQKGPLEVFADARMVDTVVRNLVNNAIKFTPERGNVTVSARRNGNCAEVEISDTGVGISADKAARLFQLGERTSTTGTGGETGTGLGLHLCKELVEKQGGQIYVESTEGEGSVFRFTLPLH